MRLADALAASGERVTVLTSDQADARPPAGGAQIRISALPFLPRRAFALLRRVLGRIVHGDFEIFWRWRIRALALPADVDVVYGRAMPLASIAAANVVANRLQRPLFVHFSDPPLSPWYTPPPMARKWREMHYLRAVEKAAGVSFTTEAALDYCRDTLGLPLGDKGFVLNHVAPALLRLPRRTSGSAPVFLYVGRFYGRRQPTALMAAFKEVLGKYPGAVLRFVGSGAENIEPQAERAGVRHAVDVLPFTREITAEYARADVLIAVDAADKQPVFLSTKLVEYLMVDRITLVITPKGSPSDLLVARSPDTTISVSGGVEEIAGGMIAALQANPGPQAFENRFASMGVFSPTSVADCFVKVAGQAARSGCAGAP